MAHKFTQEIKDKWLEALKSGKYVQGFTSLVVEPSHEANKSGKQEHCCIGVLGEVCDFLDNKAPTHSSANPYEFLHDTIGDMSTGLLYTVNDYRYSENKPLQDYTNVLPLIEELEVQS